MWTCVSYRPGRRNKELRVSPAHCASTHDVLQGGGETMSPPCLQFSPHSAMINCWGSMTPLSQLGKAFSPEEAVSRRNSPSCSCYLDRHTPAANTVFVFLCWSPVGLRVCVCAHVCVIHCPLFTLFVDWMYLISPETTRHSSLKAGILVHEWPVWPQITLPV